MTTPHTRPVFILGSGRCGTLALAQSLATVGQVEVHHEYLFENILADAVLCFLGRIPQQEMTRRLERLHGAAVHYCQKPIWVDCSNALPWIIKPLNALFPDARFVHVVRNGRRVVSSFFHKFERIMYPDDAVRILNDWLEGRYPVEPPPEKKYWRPIPVNGMAYYGTFESMDRFERLCYYWALINNHVRHEFESIDEERIARFRFEDLLSERIFGEFTEFIGIDDAGGPFNAMKRPVNVHIPRTFPLTSEQECSFRRLCSETMVSFGYQNDDDYEVEYHPAL
jgi:hypothetical protein